MTRTPKNSGLTVLKSQFISLSVRVLIVGLFLLGADASVVAQEVLPAATKTFSVEVGKGRLIRLDSPAASIFIADPEIADVQVKSPRLIYLLGQRTGETTFYAVDGHDNVLANMNVKVTHNISDLRKMLQDLVPEAKVELASVNNTLVLEGQTDSPSEAEEIRRIAERYSPGEGALINRLRITQPTQVNLRVRVAEMSRDIDKTLGFRWNLAATAGGMAIGVVTDNPFVNSVTEHTGTIVGKVGGVDVNGVIDALDEEGLVTILSEPNLTALSGETASFLAGGEFPILIPEGSDRVVIEFREYGVKLDFTPTILSKDRINLHVRPEVSQLSDTNAVTLNNFVIPSLTTRRADTTVELASGQSFAIAGLLQNNTDHSVSKYPGLGDLPILGGLFRSDRFQREETELVIIVTPYLVRPVNDPLALPAPTDGFAPPHDLERLIVGGTYRRNPEVGGTKILDPNGNKVIGPVGFELK